MVCAFCVLILYVSVDLFSIFLLLLWLSSSSASSSSPSFNWRLSLAMWVLAHSKDSNKVNRTVCREFKPNAPRLDEIKQKITKDWDEEIGKKTRSSCIVIERILFIINETIFNSNFSVFLGTCLPWIVFWLSAHSACGGSIALVPFSIYLSVYRSFSQNFVCLARVYIRYVFFRYLDQ